MSSEDKAAAAGTVCERVREDFSALLDGELSAEEQESVEAHLSECSECLRELDGLKRVDTMYGGLPSSGAAPGFEEAILSSIAPKPVRPRARRVPWTLYVPALAAACLLLVAGLYAFAPNTVENRFNVASQSEAEEKAFGAEAPLAAGLADASAPPLPEAGTAPRESMPAQAEAAGARVDEDAVLDGARPGTSAPTAEVQAKPAVRAKSALPAQGPGKGFELRDGVYVQATYAGQGPEKLARDSKALEELILAHPTIKEYVQWKRAVLFEIGGRWYSLEAAVTVADTP